ncbi:MAG: DUF6498-containing protein [Chitinophagales bacterium]
MPVIDPRERTLPVLPGILIGNMLPIIGILFYNMTFFAIMYVFWWETVFISVFDFIKMGRAKRESQPDPNYTVNGKPLSHEQANSVVYMRSRYLVFRIFILLFYLIFIIVFVGVMQTMQEDPGAFGRALLLREPWVLYSLGAYLLVQIVQYWNWIQEGKDKETSLQQLASPFSARLVIMHIVIVLGTFAAMYASDTLFPGSPHAASMGYAVLFVALKTLLDLLAWRNSSKRATILSNALSRDKNNL